MKKSQKESKIASISSKKNNSKSINKFQKAKIRASKEWKDLREVIRNIQDNKDFITQKKLTKKSAALHHMNLDASQYGNFSDLTHFMFLNSKTHSTLHFLYELYKKDKTVLDRLKIALEAMYEINQGQTFR